MRMLALFAVVVFGAVASLPAQQPAAKPGTVSVQALGNAATVDETTLSLDPVGAAANRPATAKGPDTLLYLLRMVIVLALVVGVMYLVFMLMRKLSRPKGDVDSPIRIMASSPLGAGKSLHLVGLGSKAWLIGSGEHGLSLIAEVDDKELLDGIDLELASRKTVSSDFSSILSGLIGGKKKKSLQSSVLEEPRPASGYLARQRGRLDRFRESQ
ncbi:MAG: flagellar biosynthetic protein FliO [Spirochaetota bacterium]